MYSYHMIKYKNSVRIEKELVEDIYNYTKMKITVIPDKHKYGYQMLQNECVPVSVASPTVTEHFLYTCVPNLKPQFWTVVLFHIPHALQITTSLMPAVAVPRVRPGEDPSENKLFHAFFRSSVK